MPVVLEELLLLNVLLFVEREVPMVIVGLPPALTLSIVPLPDRAEGRDWSPFTSGMPGLVTLMFDVPCGFGDAELSRSAGDVGVGHRVGVMDVECACA